jgi:hypothetical protein
VNDLQVRKQPRVLAERAPSTRREALRAEVECVARVAQLLLTRRIRQPRANVGRHLHFADGTTTTVYRETVIDRDPPASPATLIVTFTLRGVHSPWLHRLFRLESELNTVLFAGFPGLISKLWCRHDERGAYRGIYDWDGAESAEAYARSLWWVLALVSVRGSIHYRVIDGIRREEFLAQPAVIGARGRHLLVEVALGALCLQLAHHAKQSVAVVRAASKKGNLT